MRSFVHPTFRNILNSIFSTQLNALLYYYCYYCYYYCYYFRGNIRLWKGSSGKYRLFSSFRGNNVEKGDGASQPTFSIKKWSTSHRLLLENCSNLANKVFVSWERKISLEISEFVEFKMKIHIEEHNHRFL